MCGSKWRFICVTFITFVFSFTSWCYLFQAYAEPFYKERTAIYIDGNENFTKENGVVCGDGTPSNPYVIERYKFVGEPICTSPFGETYIFIGNTDVYFIIRNCVFPKLGYIHLTNATNGRIESIAEIFCILCEVCKNIEITKSKFRAGNTTTSIVIWGGENISVEDNIFYGDISDDECFIPFGISVWPTSIVKSLSLKNNQFINCRVGLWDDPEWSEGYYSTWNIDISNTINGMPIYFINSLHNMSVTIRSYEIGELIVANCTNLTLTGVYWRSPPNGTFIILHCTNLNIVNNNFTNVGNVYVYSCKGMVKFEWNWLSIEDIFVGVHRYTGSLVFYNNTFFQNTLPRIGGYSCSVFPKFDKNYWSFWCTPDMDNDGFVDDPLYYSYFPNSTQIVDPHPRSSYASHFDIFHEPLTKLSESVVKVSGEIKSTKNISNVVIHYRVSGDKTWNVDSHKLYNNTTIYEFSFLVELKREGEKIEYFLTVTDETNTTLTSAIYHLEVPPEEKDGLLYFYVIVAVLAGAMGTLCVFFYFRIRKKKMSKLKKW